MQQTKTYKLGLIEASDRFSPDPLNDNAQKVETALTGMKSDMTKLETNVRSDMTKQGTTLETRIAALEKRATTLEAKKIVAGTYTGDGKATKTIKLGFTPWAVYIHSSVASNGSTGGADAMILTGHDSHAGNYLVANIVTNGFEVHSIRPSGATSGAESVNGLYEFFYIAFGG